MVYHLWLWTGGPSNQKWNGVVYSGPKPDVLEPDRVWKLVQILCRSVGEVPFGLGPKYYSKASKTQKDS